VREPVPKRPFNPVDHRLVFGGRSVPETETKVKYRNVRDFQIHLMSNGFFHTPDAINGVDGIPVQFR
jgi:hypothetical protein